MSMVLEEESAAQEGDLLSEFSNNDGGAPRNENDEVSEYNSTAMGSFSILPQDCLDTLLTFVSLHDCLKLSSTSLTFTEEMNRCDLKRRKRRLHQSFAYMIASPALSSNNSSSSKYKYRLLEVEDCSLQQDDVVMLPSVRDRMDSLHDALPLSSVGIRVQVQLAIREMDRDEDDIIVNADLDNEEGIGERFRTAFDIQQTLLRPHRLHASLLSNAIHADPTSAEEQYVGRVLNVGLDRYMSDVLCAYFLMGHSEAGLAEGGPTERVWMNGILSETHLRSGRAASCCRAWVYLHSTLLRMAPFTLDQQSRLGIAPPTSLACSSASVADGDSLVAPPLPFMGAGRGNETKRVQVWESLRSLESLRMRLNDFGRLGPTFRGRDLIRSQTVVPSSCIDVMQTFQTMSPSDYSSNNDSLSPLLRAWCAGDESVSIGWLLCMHQEAKKSRPMTVSPPLVTVKCTENSASDER